MVPFLRSGYIFPVTYYEDKRSIFKNRFVIFNEIDFVLKVHVARAEAVDIEPGSSLVEENPHQLNEVEDDTQQRDRGHQ